MRLAWVVGAGQCIRSVRVGVRVRGRQSSVDRMEYEYEFNVPTEVPRFQRRCWNALPPRTPASKLLQETGGTLGCASALGLYSDEAGSVQHCHLGGLCQEGNTTARTGCVCRVVVAAAVGKDTHGGGVSVHCVRSAVPLDARA
jgi:hypothetical protein